MENWVSVYNGHKKKCLKNELERACPNRQLQGVSQLVQTCSSIRKSHILVSIRPVNISVYQVKSITSNYPHLVNWIPLYRVLYSCEKQNDAITATYKRLWFSPVEPLKNIAVGQYYEYGWTLRYFMVSNLRFSCCKTMSFSRVEGKWFCVCYSKL